MRCKKGLQIFLFAENKLNLIYLKLSIELTIKMADLLIEVWHLIFNRLQLTDLSACAQVSKKFYFLVKEYRIKELAFTRRVARWFHYIPANYSYRVDFKKASILKSSSFNFDFLKRLKIGRTSTIDDLNVINRLPRLEELDIDLKNYKNEKSTRLSLANLKVLHLFMADHLSYLELDAPRLTKLCTVSLEMLEFLHPESIRCIQTFSHNGKLSLFKNLECLLLTDHFNRLGYVGTRGSQKVFKEFSIVNLTKLNEISFCYRHGEYEKKNMKIFKEFIKMILDSERSDLAIFWENVRVTDILLLTKYETIMDKIGSLVAFQLCNYGKLKSRVEFFWEYDFNESMNLLLKMARFDPRSDAFLSKFFAKYSSILKIRITGRVTEAGHLMQVIGKSRSLTVLEFTDTFLTQKFFDVMPETVCLNRIPLQFLRLKGIQNGIQNFEFVLKLLDLQLFETGQKLPNEIVFRLLTMPWLTDIKFCTNRRRIERLSTSRFRVNGKLTGWQDLLKMFNPNSLTLPLVVSSPEVRPVEMNVENDFRNYEV